MTIAEQIQIVEDNLNEYGVCDITLEEYNYLKDELYSSGCLAGIELGKAEVLDKVAEKLKADIEKYWYRSELDMSADNVNCLIDEVIAEMKAEVSE